MRIAEGLALLDRARALPSSDAVAARHHIVAGQLASVINRPDASALLRTGLGLADGTDIRQSRLVVGGWCSLGAIHNIEGHVDAAAHCARRAEESAGDDVLLNELAISFSAFLAAARGENMQAVKLGLASVAILRQFGDDYELLTAICPLLQPMVDLGLVKQARQLSDEAMELCTRVPFGRATLQALCNTAVVDLAQDRTGAAIGLATQVLRRTLGTVDPYFQAMGLLVLAVGHAQVRDSAAPQYLGASDRVFADMGYEVERTRLAWCCSLLDDLALDERYAATYDAGYADPAGAVRHWLADAAQI